MRFGRNSQPALLSGAAIWHRFYNEKPRSCHLHDSYVVGPNVPSSLYATKNALESGDQATSALTKAPILVRYM